LGAWLQRDFLLSDFWFLVFVVAFLVNPLLYGFLIYPAVSLADDLNRKNEAPSIKS